MHYLAIVECVLFHENKFLLIRRPSGVHAGGLLAFPGGKVELEDGIEGEDVLKIAIQREVKEEVGIELLDPLVYVTSSTFIDSFGEHVLDVLFFCKIQKSSTHVVASPREVPEYFWLTKEEIEERSDAPIWVKRYIACVDKLKT